MVNYLMGRYTVGMRQACRCVQMTRSMYYYRSRMDPQTALRHRMREIAHARVRFGYRRVYIMLRREGWDVGKDRFYRLYREENLGLRRKRPWRHVSAVHRLERRPAARANEVHVVAAMNRLKYDRGLPERITTDNGSEFSGGQMDLWAYNNHVRMDFSRRGKPTDNAIVESFNGRFREECLNAHWFESIDDASEKIDA
jgi:putative transposase